jgi:ATP-dependent exoDNAse (exonuclease V) alpha subunit
LGHHLERKSVASDKEILATAIKSSVGDTMPEQVKNAFDKDNNILSAQEKLRTFITTKEALREEQQLIGNVNQAKNKFRPIDEHFEPKNALLKDQQIAAVKHALSTTDGISIITGKAGTGKTTLMKEVKQGIVQSGKQIFSFAPSSEASRGVLRSEGFESADTVAKLMLDKNLQSELNGQVIWIDEAGMLSNRDMNKVFDIAKAQLARIILSGDTKQHNSVQRGDALRIVEQYGGIKPITVNKIQRQKNQDYKEAVKLLSDGGIEKGFKKLEKIGSIKEIADGKERVKAIADDYYASAFSGKEQRKEVLVIAPTHAEGEIVTGSIRNKLKEKQVIGDEDREFKILKNLQLTEAEKKNPEKYNKGNVLLLHKNTKGVKEGSRLEVTACEADRLVAQDAKGIQYQIPLAEANKFSVHQLTEINVTKGDRIRMTGNGKSTDGKHLFNGTTFNIEGFDKQGNIKLSNGSTISKDYGQFNLGYVLTSHASQGKTADKVIISQSSATFRASSMEQFYVSVSRGKQAVSVYTDSKESLKDAIS